MDVTPPQSNPAWEVTKQIAETLNEKTYSAKKIIRAIVHHYGTEQTLALLQETLTIEANGGLMTNDQSRRRTVGGVFFFLAKGRMPKETVKQIFPHYTAGKAKNKGANAAQ